MKFFCRKYLFYQILKIGSVFWIFICEVKNLNRQILLSIFRQEL